MRPSITAQKFVVLEGRSELKFNFYFQEGYYVGHGHVPLVVNRLAGAMSLKSTPMLGKRSIAAPPARFFTLSRPCQSYLPDQEVRGWERNEGFRSSPGPSRPDRRLRHAQLRGTLYYKIY